MVLGWGKPASKYLFTHVTSQLMHQCLRLIVIICFDFAVAFIFWNNLSSQRCDCYLYDS